MGRVDGWMDGDRGITGEKEEGVRRMVASDQPTKRSGLDGGL